MNGTKNKNNSYIEKNHGHSQSQVGFNKALEFIKEQIDFDSFEKSDKPQVEEICLIIAEIMNLCPRLEIRIGGTRLSCKMVQEIYSRLNSSHIEMVMQNFNKTTYEIHHKKTYLRTALYNAAFENESYWQNQVQKDMHGGV